MMKKLRIAKSGFTVVELLIVIVVIGILAALVLNTFSGIQARARDAERKTDLNALHTQLEVYYNDNGFYPTLANITTANLAGLDPEALNDPSGDALHDGTGTGDYSYSCTAGGGGCTSYTLSADMESSTPDPFTKASLN